MLPTLQLGPLVLPVPALLLLVGLWIGINLTEKHARFYGVPAGQLGNLLLTGLIAGLLGARLGYILSHLDAFYSAPWNALALNTAMLHLPSAWLAGVLAALIYGQRRRLPLWPTLDTLTSLAAALAVASGLAHLASGDAYGAPTRLPWGLYLWGETRHHTQVYETILTELVAMATWPRPATRRSAPGVRFLSFSALLSAAYLFLEAFRGDSALISGVLRQNQIVAWLILALSLYLLGRRRQAAAYEEATWTKS